MKKKIIVIYRYLNALGVNLILTVNGVKNIGFYIRDYFKIKKTAKNNKDFKINLSYPCLHDKNANGGVASGHYFYQDLYVAKKIFENNPEKHVDIGSRIDGFIAHLAVFRKVEVFDIRNIESKTKNIVFKQADFINLNKKLVNYTDSISSLHAIEHFGLGRYGDPIDINGHIKGLNNIYKILKKGGTLYFSVPIGNQRIEFNAHRVFSIKYLFNLFKDLYTIKSFVYVDDKGDLHEDVDIKKGFEDNFGCDYGCGIFELIKI